MSRKHQGRRVPTPDEVAESVRLAHLARERHRQGAPTDEDGRDDRPVSVQGIFGHYSRKPLVEITIGPERATWSPGLARQIGLWLIEASDAAATDGFLVSFFSQRNYSEEDIAKILYLFRQHRAEERQEAERAAALAQLDTAEQQATESFLWAFLADAAIEAAAIEGFVRDWRTHRAMTRVDSA